jgi:hypothetical protein
METLGYTDRIGLSYFKHDIDTIKINSIKGAHSFLGVMVFPVVRMYDKKADTNHLSRIDEGTQSPSRTNPYHRMCGVGKSAATGIHRCGVSGGSQNVSSSDIEISPTCLVASCDHDQVGKSGDAGGVLATAVLARECEGCCRHSVVRAGHQQRLDLQAGR